jgi:hypothetical protein
MAHGVMHEIDSIAVVLTAECLASSWRTVEVAIAWSSPSRWCGTFPSSESDALVRAHNVRDKNI